MITTAIILAVLHLASSATLPATFKQCHQKDPSLNECLKVAVQDAIQQIGTNGIPDLGVGPLEPMAVKEVKVDQGGHGPVAIKLQFTNLKIYGIPESTITKADTHLDKYQLISESQTPIFRFDADYVIDGQILVLPIRGKGVCNITLESLTAVHDIKGKPVTRDGEVYMELTSYGLKLKTKRLHTRFENLFNGDKTLGDTMNKVLNENHEVIFNELRSSLEKAFGNVFLEYSKGIFHNVPFNSIFLP
ncbi:protein takeout-like isoform X1 [Periplaneta americana]|uniref:protein takeout-like isoform X1 n=1 Tax=Periplaneta americana TaxID=6978 RepID=UPI0037E6FE29